MKHKYSKGYKFNDLMVLEFLGKIKNENHTFYKCICKCGKEVIIRSQQINIQKSCGCATSRINPYLYKSKPKYPKGYKFNNLTVLEFLGQIKNDRHSFYKCKCDCGKEIIIRTQQINIQKSCGCLQK